MQPIFLRRGALVVVLALFAAVRLLAATNLVEFQPRGGLPNVLAKLHAGGDVRVAYLGGSITAQPGWRPKTLKWFQEQFPAAHVSEINAAIGGTGSDLGVFRVVGQPNVNLIVDRGKADRFGINVSDISSLIQNAIGGEPVSCVYLGDRRYDVSIRYIEGVRNSPEAIANLTDAEKTQICDWVASLYGGYGKSMTCPDDSPVIGPATQADCLAQTTSITSNCAATVAQEEICMQAVRACAQDAATAACSALHACYLVQ